MAKRVDVLFHSEAKNKDVRAAVPLSPQIKAVLFFPFADGTTSADFAQQHGLEPKAGKISMPNTVFFMEGKEDKNILFSSADGGPGVCYWVDETLVCW